MACCRHCLCVCAGICLCAHVCVNCKFMSEFVIACEHWCVFYSICGSACLCWCLFMCTEGKWCMLTCSICVYVDLWEPELQAQSQRILGRVKILTETDRLPSLSAAWLPHKHTPTLRSYRLALTDVQKYTESQAIPSAFALLCTTECSHQQEISSSDKEARKNICWLIETKLIVIRWM